jgi:hypothetical protein
MAATYIQTGNTLSNGIVRGGLNWREKISEGFWCTTCLILFMILGPFAAPIVLAFMFSRHALNENAIEPDPVVER